MSNLLLLRHQSLMPYDDGFVWKDGNDTASLCKMMKSGTRLNEMKWQAQLRDTRSLDKSIRKD